MLDIPALATAIISYAVLFMAFLITTLSHIKAQAVCILMTHFYKHQKEQMQIQFLLPNATDQPISAVTGLTCWEVTGSIPGHSNVNSTVRRTLVTPD
jgi:hypothetical protein